MERETQQGSNESNFSSPGESSFCVVDPGIDAAHFTYFLSALCVRSLSLQWLDFQLFGRRSLKMHVLKVDLLSLLTLNFLLSPTVVEEVQGTKDCLRVT